MSRQTKKEFYERLSLFDHDGEDDTEDEGSSESKKFLMNTQKAAQSKRSKGAQAQPTPAGSSPAVRIYSKDQPAPFHPRRTPNIAAITPTVIRSVSAPDRSPEKVPDKEVITIEDTPLRTVNPPPPVRLIHSVSTSLLGLKTSMQADVPRALGKRKRDATIIRKPDTECIFKDLVFYFFPNDDKNPARRMRIIKVLEYGGTWAKEWREGVTHVVVDKSMTYQQVIGWLKISTLPPDMVCVNEAYPSECISFLFLKNWREPQFQVKGCPEALPPTSSDERAQKAMSPVSSVPSSLPLKPDKRNAREPRTPSRVDESSFETRQRQDKKPYEAKPADTTSKPATLELIRKQGALPAPSAKVVRGAITGYSIEDAISEAKEFQHLPLDLDEDDTASIAGSATGEEPSDDESAAYLSPLKKQRLWQDNFQCMEKHDGTAKDENPNKEIIDLLEQMGRYYDQTHDSWRTLAYRKAVATLRKQRHRITSKEEARRLPYVGESLAAKIEEVTYTNRLQRLESARAEPTEQSLRLFLGIYGVGLSQASKWVERGFKTLDDLLEKAKLTDNQKIGIEHYDDFNSRIPRTEVEQHGAYVRAALHKIDSTFEVTVGGSYRRGAKDSGDIDLIITKPAEKIEYIRNTLIDTLIPQLTAEGFLKCALAATSRQTGTKWHGASCLPGFRTWRRIDFLFVPWDEIGAALIYFTGNDIFNRSLRLLASKKGMKLNQRGLYKECMRGKNMEKLTEGELVEGRDEKKIFRILGVPWRQPEHRNC